MSTSPPRARAVARVRPADNAPVGEARLVRRRRPGYLGPLHLLQLLLLEAVVLGILVAVKSGPVIVAGAAVLAVLLLAVMLSRRNGRWWLEVRIIGRQYRGRRRRHAVPAADARLAALRVLAPGLSVRD